MIEIIFIIVLGSYSLPFDVSVVVAKSAIEQLERETGKDFRIVQIKKMRDPTKRFRSVNDRYVRFNLLKQEAFKRKLTNRNQLKHFIIPPIIDGRVRLLAGLANATCALNRTNPISASNAQIKNDLNQNRLPHSKVAIVHEIGHLIGANHDDSLPPSIMNSNALAYVDSNLKFSNRSKQEIRECLK